MQAQSTLTSSGLAAWLCRAFWRSSTCCCSSLTCSRLSLQIDHHAGRKQQHPGRMNSKFLTKHIRTQNIELKMINKKSSGGYEERKPHPTDLVRHKNSVNLFSVSSSLRILCASWSWACRAAIFSLSHSSCCTLSILFSCCSLMNFSLKIKKNK